MRDAAAVLGFVAVVAGCWWIYPPVALIVGGGLLMVSAAFGVLRNATRTTVQR